MRDARRLRGSRLSGGLGSSGGRHGRVHALQDTREPLFGDLHLLQEHVAARRQHADDVLGLRPHLAERVLVLTTELLRLDGGLTDEALGLVLGLVANLLGVGLGFLAGALRRGVGLGAGLVPGLLGSLRTVSACASAMASMSAIRFASSW